MTKKDLVKLVAYHTNSTNAQASQFVDLIFGKDSLILEALRGGDSVNIYGFGTFAVKHKNARTAINPKTGEPCDVPAKDVITFKISPKIKTL